MLRWVSGLKKLIKTKNKKFIYLISPDKIYNKEFYNILEEIFNLKKIEFFQLRLKSKNTKVITQVSKKIKKICKKHKVKFLINNHPIIAKKIGADGCHIGQNDMNAKEAKNILKNKIVGMTCHNSIKLVKKAIKNKADYIALGAFYSSKTKKVKFKANFNVLNSVKKITKVPIVAIGGINSENYKKLLLNKADFLAISGFIWKNKYLKPTEAIRKLK